MSFNFAKKDLFNEFKGTRKDTAIQGSARQSPSQSSSKQSARLSFSQMNLCPVIVEALNSMGYTIPTPIQANTLEHCLKDQDLLCLSETGSGKTLSFVLPIVNYLVGLSKQQIGIGAHALILSPTRQLCIQTNDYFNRFREAGVAAAKSVVIYGGVDPMQQVMQLSTNPAVIVGTPGRILDHLRNTKGFDMHRLKYLVLDEADKLLNKDFEQQLNQILQMLPKEKNAYLFSATMTQKVQKLQRVSLRNPILIQVSQKYQTVSTLSQSYIFIPSKLKDCYLVYLLSRNYLEKTIVFAQTRLGAERLNLVLREIQFTVQCLHGEMSQIQRVKSLEKFKNGEVRILVCTDVAARGIDISMIEFVINYDLCDPKNYIHRVGRTARVGQNGQAISIVTQYDVEAFKKIEDRMGCRISEYPVNNKQAEVFLQKLEECHKVVSAQMKKKHKRLDYN